MPLSITIRLTIAGALIISVLASPGNAEQLSVTCDDRNITLGQIVDLPDTFSLLSDRVVARIPGDADYLTLRPDELDRLLSRNLPELEAPLRYSQVVRFQLSDKLVTSELDQGSHCFKLVSPVAQGQIISRSSLMRGDCDQENTGSDLVLFDRQDLVLRASLDLPSGTFLGQLALPTHQVKQAGVSVTLQVRSGPITIERSGHTLQPAQEGYPVFIQLDDGEIVVAPIQGEAA